MKIEIRCGGCDKIWQLDASSAGGDMVCANCLSRIKVPADAAVQSKPQATAAPGVARSARSAPALSGEVVCPRCKLHFSPRSKPAESTTESRKTVLVIEDQEYFRRVAADSLSESYEVKTAASSERARQVIAGGGIDLIVLDLTLEGDDGGRQLLIELQPKPCPVLIFTARDESEMYGDHWDELVDLGADDLVIKGMQVGESLVRKVSALLGEPVEEKAAME